MHLKPRLIEWKLNSLTTRNFCYPLTHLRYKVQTIFKQYTAKQIP